MGMLSPEPGYTPPAEEFISTLPGRLYSGVQLTSLSPLSDRRKLCASPALENVAMGLSSFGYQVGWDEGSFQVSTASSSTRPRDAPTSVSLDTFMGAQTRKRDSYGYRPKVASSVTFTKGAFTTGAKSGAMISSSGSLAPPQPSPDVQPRAQRSSTPPPPSLISAQQNQQNQQNQQAVRFSRLAQSVDSLQQLQVQVGGNINGNNLITLSQPSYSNMTASPTAAIRPSTAPGSSGMDPTTPTNTNSNNLMTDQMTRPASSGRPAASSSYDQQSANVPHHTEGGVSTSAVSRPGTAQVVDLNKAAGAALRPSTSGPGLTRPHTTRPSSRSCGSSNGPRAFRPTRGHALVVFQDMDKDKNGKVTLSELEDAALAVGFSLAQAHRLFNRMDKSGKGYLQASDWGNLEMSKVVELFSLVYMQRFMGLPGPTARPEQVSKYWAMQDLKAVRSMAAAIHMARSNALLRGAHAASNSGNVVFEAFRFIDTDGSGRLSFEELRDGFYALGVFVKDEVMHQMMNHFDGDKDGTINYHEFVMKMFPNTSSRGMR